MSESDLVCIVGEVNFVEDLGCLVLDRLHFHQMRGVLPGSVTDPMRTTKRRKKKKLRGQGSNRHSSN